MKKIVFISLFGSLVLFTACGKSDPKSTTSDTHSTNITTSTTTIHEEQSSSTQSTQVQASLSTEPVQMSSETIPSSSPAESSGTSSVSTQDQMLQYLIDHTPELQNEDIMVSFYEMVGPDYLFSATSQSIKNQGGSGSVGFYRVSPEGTITLTDAYGNPF
ncbi:MULTISPECIES: hypothetical protein [unclassified Enterococcus]|uniref:hypothetical protein n=1 Tax=unclassified Enterococcus TaxID=2608891 RepID=UPI0013E9DE8F|nr:MULTISPECIES: hypothetical protein [unclassified Enterococcus]